MLALASLPQPAHAEQAIGLQTLVDRAEPGAEVLVPAGTYEGPVTIDQPLTMRPAGDGAVVLVNHSGEPALTIRGDGSTVAGLEIRDESLKETPTVLVTGDRVVLEDLRIRTGAVGIAVQEADDGAVTGAVIEWAAPDVHLADRGNGIDLYRAHRWRLEDNAIRDVHDGIYIERSDDTRVAANSIERSRYGIHLMYTNGTVVEGNVGTANITGAMVMVARQVSVTGNTFAKQSENVYSQGILLYDVQESVVADNTVDGNRVGMYVERSSGNRVADNRIRYNFLGLQLLESSGNTFTANQFIGNALEALASGSEDNDLAGNYWDGFRGIDADGDGRSDLPYAINPFFQHLTMRQPAFQLFFQSPGMVFLEGLYRFDRRDWTTDAAPLMAPTDSGAQAFGSQGGAATGVMGVVLLGGAVWIWFIMRRRQT
jgi:nitrous oxidase accessory protein